MLQNSQDRSTIEQTLINKRAKERANEDETSEFHLFHQQMGIVAKAGDAIHVVFAIQNH